jgi:glycosyltransferase involved in cell wall biosynthesis
MIARRLRIFVAHPSEVLTDHLPHGDGLVSYSYVRRLAERGHELHVAAQRVALRDPLPHTLHVHRLSPEGGTSAMNRLVFMARMRELFERLRNEAPFDVIHQMNPVFTGLSLALVGVRTPLVLGAFVPRWQSDSTTVAAQRPSLKTRLAEAAERLVARRQQAQAAALLIASPEALARICRPARHEGRIFEIPHGIDLSGFPPRTRVPARPSVLFLTSVQYRKGIFTLLDAFARVSRAVPGVELVIGSHSQERSNESRWATSCAGTPCTACRRSASPSV